MEVNNAKLWQQACGDTDRNYSEVCLEWDVILNGPGYAGKYPECRDQLIKDNWSSRKITDLRRFAEEMKDGDIVVLRLGTSDVLGVGLIVGEYNWDSIFEDIDGWDLQHYRRVRWLWKTDGYHKKFKLYALKQGDTTQELTSPDVIEWIKSLGFTDPVLNRPLKELPVNTRKHVSHEEIGDYLYDKGISSKSIETLIKEFNELTRIAKWYIKEKSNEPSEHETVAYLVVPILRALGWTPQKMAVEWKNVDLALFSDLPRSDQSLSVVVEAKKKGNACLTAKSQAQGYAQGKENCKRLIVTDGLRYGTFVKIDNEFRLKAYFNLLNLVDDYPIYNCKGVKEALRLMTPEWNEKT